MPLVVALLLIAAYALWRKSQGAGPQSGATYGDPGIGGVYPAPVGIVPNGGPVQPVGTSNNSDPFGLDAVARAVAQIESGNRQTYPDGRTVVSPAGAIGVMQLMPGTAAGLGVDPYDEQQNRAAGESYLQQLFDKYGNWDDALAAYNWGPGNVDMAQDQNYDYPSSVYDYVESVKNLITG
jgi:Transglycosylase SLT domain